MKVIFFNSTRAWGGGEKWHLEMALALHEKGLDTIVFTNKKSELYNRLSLTDLRIHRIKISNLSFLNPYKVLLLKKIFQGEQPDCIIMNLSADLKVAGLAAWLAGVKKIVYRRGSAIPVRNSLLNRLIFRHIVTDIIANSEETRRTILHNNEHLFPAQKIRVIYNGLDIEKYNKAQITKTFPRKKDELVVGNLGRFVRQKGQHYLVTLAQILKNRHIPASVIIGGEGPLKDDIEALARKSGVIDMIRFARFVDDVKGFMSSVDVFVLTSLWEGFGYVIAEAMFYEKPVIAFNVSSNPELIIDAENGFLCDPGDVQDMASKIELLHKEREAITKLGKAGKEFVIKNFTLKRTVDELLTFLRQ